MAVLVELNCCFLWQLGYLHVHGCEHGRLSSPSTALGMMPGTHDPSHHLPLQMVVFACHTTRFVCGLLFFLGKQAEVLNQVIGELLDGHPVSETKLKEVLGHTPLQVMAIGYSPGAYCMWSQSTQVPRLDEV